MTRHLFFAIALIGTGAFLTSPAEAQKWQCEDRAANCIGQVHRQGSGDQATGDAWTNAGAATG